MYRQATTADCEAIRRLIGDMESRELDAGRFGEIFRAQLQSDLYLCLVAERGGRVVGVLNLRLEEQLHHAGRIAEILELAVDADCRNRGIGAGLLDEACRLARERGCAQIEVACNQLRTDTHRFYLREGMRNCHYKFSKPLTGDPDAGNAIGR